MNSQIIPPEKYCLITDIPGYTHDISRLICMMNYARQVTLHSVKGLTVGELDYQIDDTSNSIGALLHHIAAGDFYYQVSTFEDRELNEEELKKWGPALHLGKEARDKIKGNDLEYYINILNEVRDRTYELLKEKDDKWLAEKVTSGKNEFNIHYFWFHVFEDEINHRGQINFIKKRLGK
ncbi:MAG: DinB family protein [Ignavibacteria bacterium]|nr:DinB family protein [Ignavibacteria bacterium]